MPDTPAPSRSSGKPPAILLSGVPDDNYARSRYVAWDKPPQLILGGTASFLAQLPDPPFHLMAITMGGGQTLDLRLPRAPFVNFMADADRFRRGLGQALKLLEAARGRCFNHPAAVLASSRDAVARNLQGIPGLVVPRTVRAKVDTLDQLKAAMQEAGIGFPLIVRLAGNHGGAETARVMHDGDWQALNPLGWGGQPIYLTQYVDYADPDGLYRKTRLVLVGGRAMARHHMVASQWLVHTRDPLPAHALEEDAMVQHFERDTLPAVQPALQEAARRLGLDCFGMDVSLRPDGSVLLFEANASMDLLDVSASAAPACKAAAQTIALELRALLAAPHRWCAPLPQEAA